MVPRLAPMHLNNGLNEKRRKTNGTINDEGIQKDTPIYRNSMYTRDRKDVTSYLKENIIDLS